MEIDKAEIHISGGKVTGLMVGKAEALEQFRDLLRKVEDWLPRSDDAEQVA